MSTDVSWTGGSCFIDGKRGCLDRDDYLRSSQHTTEKQLPLYSAARFRPVCMVPAVVRKSPCRRDIHGGNGPDWGLLMSDFSMKETNGH